MANGLPWVPPHRDYLAMERRARTQAMTRRFAARAREAVDNVEHITAKNFADNQDRWIYEQTIEAVLQLERQAGTLLASCGRETDLIHVSNPSNSSVDGLPALIDPTTDGVATRLRRYVPAHERALEMAAYLDDLARGSLLAGNRDLTDIANRLTTCGTWLEFQDFAPAGLQESRLAAGCFCGLFRLCPMCAIRRGARWLRTITPKLVGVVRQYLADNPDGCLMLATCTVRNGRSLRHRFEHMADSWRRLQGDRRRYVRWRDTSKGHRQRAVELAEADGCIYAFEVKRGVRSGLWHPHVHAVLLCRRPLDAQKFSQDWQRVTTDSFVTDVRVFHSMDAIRNADLDSSAIAEALADDLAEVVKYAVKFTSLPLRDNWLAERVLYGRRLRDSWGLFRGMNPDADLCDAPLELADVPYIERVAKWVDGGYLLDGDRLQLQDEQELSPCE